jgi:hypothetical protein
MGFPAELSVQGHAQVFSCVSIWYLLIVNSNWDVFKASDGKVNMNRFRFIKLDVQFFVQFYIWFMAVCNFPVDSSLPLPIVNIAVSSAKVATVLFSNF